MARFSDGLTTSSAVRFGTILDAKMADFFERMDQIHSSDHGQMWYFF